MLRIHECHLTAPLLGLCQNVQSQGGFTGGFRSVNLNNPSLGNAANAQGCIQCQRAGGDGIHVHFRAVTQTHNRAFAKVLLNLRQCSLECFLLVLCRRRCLIDSFFRSHFILPPWYTGP